MKIGNNNNNNNNNQNDLSSAYASGFQAGLNQAALDARNVRLGAHAKGASRHAFNAQVGPTLGLVALGAFVGMAVYRPDVFVGLMSRVAEYVPAAAGNYLKSLDFTNSMVMKAIGSAISYGIGCKVLPNVLFYATTLVNSANKLPSYLVNNGVNGAKKAFQYKKEIAIVILAVALAYTQSDKVIPYFNMAKNAAMPVIEDLIAKVKSYMA